MTDEEIEKLLSGGQKMIMEKIKMDKIANIVKAREKI